ncbi:MAG: hypothetical protein ACYTG7_23570 [Planctomycetota bacterium]|jgi:hypothetical protein
MSDSFKWNGPTKKAIDTLAAFYDARKVGDVGALGFRRSTHLAALVDSLEGLIRDGFLVPGKTRFLDMGCADGRVNVLMSYLVKISVGVEVDEWTLEDHTPLREQLEAALKDEDLPRPPDNCFLLQGDTLLESTQQEIEARSGMKIDDFDLFFTYITLHEEFARLIAEKGRRGAIFMIYGLDVVLPRYPGLTLLEEKSPVHNKLVIYRKE